MQNDIDEKEQRWGAKTVEGSGHVESIKYVVFSKYYEYGASSNDKLLRHFKILIWYRYKLILFVYFSINKLREQVETDHAKVKQKEQEEGPKASYGYGGKFGVQKDRMDKVCTSVQLNRTM